MACKTTGKPLAAARTPLRIATSGCRTGDHDVVEALKGSITYYRGIRVHEGTYFCRRCGAIAPR